MTSTILVTIRVSKSGTNYFDNIQSKTNMAAKTILEAIQGANHYTIVPYETIIPKLFMGQTIIPTKAI